MPMARDLKPANLPLPPIPDQRFACCSIDPPWHFESRAPVKNPETSRLPQKHYPTMSLDAIKDIPMRDVLAPDAFVFLWLTGPLLVKGVHNVLFRAWGLQPVSLAFVWVKLRADFDTGALQRTPLLESDLHFGMGYSTRQNAEVVMLARRGSPARRRADVRQVIVSNRREHSRKPEEFFRRVEHFCDGPRIDMFAGAERPGWTSWGWPHRSGERGAE